MNKVFDIKERSYQFCLTTIQLIKKIPYNLINRTLVSQLVRSCTSIPANLTEGSAGSSKKDFINFNYHALKSTKETIMWLKLLKDLKTSAADKINPLIKEAIELDKIISTIILNSKKNLK